MEALTEGRSVLASARRALVDPDHLCVLVREATGLTPAQISRARTLASRIEGYRSQGPPRSGSSLYRRQSREWQRIDRELDRLLGDLEADNPLADWAKAIVVNATRPDFRRQPYRDRVRAQKREELERLEAFWREFDERFGPDLLSRPPAIETLETSSLEVS